MHTWTVPEWLTFFSGLGILAGTIIAGVTKVLAAIREIHIAINSRMDDLLKMAKEAAHAEAKEAAAIKTQEILQEQLKQITPNRPSQ